MTEPAAFSTDTEQYRHDPNRSCRSPYLIGCLTTLILLSLIWHAIKIEVHVRRLKREALLARILVPGRSQAEVAAWLGPPDRIAERSAPARGEGERVMIYGSGTSNLNPDEDIWIVINKRSEVVRLYYPGHPLQRKLVTPFGVPPPVM